VHGKQKAYLELVEKRKECGLCGTALTNPSRCEGGVHDNTGHIGPWTQWQGNLHADLMLIAQDWGGTEYYIQYRGKEEDTNITNKRVCELLTSIGVSIELPNRDGERMLFFTNAVLCFRPGLLTTGPQIKSRCFTNCSTAFLRPQVELVNPKVVVTLGRMAYRSLMTAYGKKPKERMREAVTEAVELTEGTCLVPVFHPGNNGTRSRSFENQKQDWQRVRNALADRDSSLLRVPAASVPRRD
jgi:uracil-DNA glycosylase family 4